MTEEGVIVIELGPKKLALLAAAALLLAGAACFLVESARPSITVVTDRGEYRPGDLVVLSGVLSGGWSTLPGVDVGVDVRGPSSEIL